MKRKAIKWRIFKYNLIIIVLLVTLVSIISNIAIKIYMEKATIEQLRKIAYRTRETALRKGPDFIHGRGGLFSSDLQNINEILRYYYTLDRSLREPLSMLNADYLLLDKDMNIIIPVSDEYFTASTGLIGKIANEVKNLHNFNSDTYINISYSGTEYLAVVMPVSNSNSFGLGWIVIYSSLEKVNQLQWSLNAIFIAILIVSALIAVVFSSLISKRISAPFSSLSQYIRAIAERNFENKIQIPVDDELQEFVNNINIMSEKLEKHDKAQKTFLQNVSHEFRTPLMSIQSYAEGIKYHVVENDTAANVIIDESKRMTHLVEDLLYLSRLDSIEENYNFNRLDFNDMVKGCIERIKGIAIKNDIKIIYNSINDNIIVSADEEKLSRAITNVLSNCIRYAKSTVSLSSKILDGNSLELIISDDGPGFEEKELPNIFERFFKGKKGNLGLGLAISKNVIEKHGGRIYAQNSQSGALFTIELPVK